MQITHKPTERSLTSSSARLHAIKSEGIDGVWPAVAPLLSRAVERSEGRYSMSSVHRSLKERKCQLWLVVDTGLRGVVVTEIYTYPTGLKAVNVLFLSGERCDEWLHLWSQIEDWARSLGCGIAEFRGRNGWLKKLDWKETGIEMVKEL